MRVSLAAAAAFACARAFADEPPAAPPAAAAGAAAPPAAADVAPVPTEASFADALFAEGDYYRAIGEYKRVLHRHPGSPLSGQWLLRIGEAYRKGGQEKVAAEHFDALVLKRPDLAGAARVHAARARLHAGDAAGAEAGLRLVLDGETAATEARRLLGWALLKQERDEDAAAAFAAAGAADLAERTRALGNLPRKDPLLAGLLSVIPGVGHFYIEEPAVGLAALVWNALFAWAAWDAFSRGDYGTAAVLATFESIWYGGAIVGAIGGAFRYNRDARLNAIEEMEKEFPP